MLGKLQLKVFSSLYIIVLIEQYIVNSCGNCDMMNLFLFSCPHILAKVVG